VCFQLFDKVDDDSNGVMSIEEHSQHLEDALEPYKRWGDSNAERNQAENYYDGDEENYNDVKNTTQQDDTKKHEEL